MIAKPLEKKRLPRYTSFPAVPHWTKRPTNEEWFEQLSLGLKENNKANIYIHIPFCKSICYYCACNKTIIEDHSVEIEYIESIISEWSHYAKHFNPIITNIHLGGGTPTFLSPQSLDYLLSSLKKIMNISNDFFGSIEIDPRTTTLDHLEIVKKHGFNRISMGIQDFSPKVQKAINRIQSFELIENLTEKLRDLCFESINFDLIYGLPFQTQESIIETFSKVITLSPDSISFFSYAHVPWMHKTQNVLNKYILPTGNYKNALFNVGKQLLQENGYHQLAFDHFSKKTDSLFRCKEKKQLRRNFMGFTSSEADVILGLGSSSISQSGHGFIQNERNYQKYMLEIKNNGRAVIGGHTQSLLDITTNKVIQSLMCYQQSFIGELIMVMDKKLAMKTMLNLNLLIDEKMVTLKDNILRITEKGFPYIRRICNAFDYYYNK